MKPRGFRQARCPGCGLTDAGCVCGLHARLDCPVSISVVMSRPEARSASNSARLLALWLQGVELHVRGAGGDGPDPEALAARPGTALLFPGAGRPQPLPEGVRHLIVPDGTWAQARRIERRWFAAQGLPRVALWGPWPSVYGLRRGREGLCTFEAVALALGVLHDRALAGVLLGRFAEWARRAQQLKAGGAPGFAASTHVSTAVSAAVATGMSRAVATTVSTGMPTAAATGMPTAAATGMPTAAATRMPTAAAAGMPGADPGSDGLAAALHPALDVLWALPTGTSDAAASGASGAATSGGGAATSGSAGAAR